MGRRFWAEVWRLKSLAKSETMNRPITDGKQFGILRMLDEYARAKGKTISDLSADDEFLKQIKESLRAHRDNDILLHGFRAQTMFAYFAAGLRGCKLITEEDMGDFYSDEDDLKRPDFRLLPYEGEEFFVEVKNFHQSNPSQSFVAKYDYVAKLERYATAFHKALLFAIYWTRWGIWTLNLSTDFTRSGNELTLDLCQAMKSDQKTRLGDRWIAIPKPFAMRFYSDENKPRAVGTDGKAPFTIKRVAFFAAGREVVDAFEIGLANFFFHFGPWEDFSQSSSVEDGELIWLEMQPVREDPNPNEDFLMLGPLSWMISRQFDAFTIDEGKVTNLSPKVEPSKLGVVIPSGFKGEVLGIWQFNQKA
jgi:hypothetical protein